MALSEDQCPDCKGQLGLISEAGKERWVCQAPCGFETHASMLAARIILASAYRRYRETMRLLSQADAAMPGSNVTQDFKRFLSQEE